MAVNGEAHRIPALPAGVADLEAEVIRHPNHVAAMNAISALHARYQPPGTPKRLKARGLLIVGDSGAGKSTALEDYWRRFPEIRLEDTKDGSFGGVVLPPKKLDGLQDGNIRRVLWLEMPKRPTQRSFMAAILGSMGYKAGEHWNTDDIIKKIVFTADQLGVEVILVDEGHSLVAEGDAKATKDVIEFLKSLLNRIGIPIVIAGLPHLLQLRDNRIDKQMARRLHPSVHLRPYSWGNRAGRIRFIALIKRFEDLLALPEPSNLFVEANAARLYVGTGGEVGWVSKYLSRCCELLPLQGLRSITMALLSEVHAGFECSVAEIGDEIDFGVELKDMGPPPTTALLIDDDPFLCRFERLGHVWQARKPKPDLKSSPEETGAADGSRRSLLRGKGPKPVTAFGG